MSHSSFHVVSLKIPEKFLLRTKEKLFAQEDCLGLQKEKIGSNRMLLKAYFLAKTSLSDLLEGIEKRFPEIIEIKGNTIGGNTRYH